MGSYLNTKASKDFGGFEEVVKLPCCDTCRMESQHGITAGIILLTDYFVIITFQIVI